MHEALAIARRTDDINTQADCLMVLAEVLRAPDRQSEGEAALHEAIELYDRKGNLVAAAKARVLATESVT